MVKDVTVKAFGRNSLSWISGWVLKAITCILIRWAHREGDTQKKRRQRDHRGRDWRQAQVKECRQPSEAVGDKEGFPPRVSGVIVHLPTP